MSMIYIINRQTDRIIGHLNNRGDKVFKDDLHVRDLSTGENTFTFTMAAKIKQAALFNQPITLAIRKEEGDFAEFIPFQGHTIDNWTKVFGIASYVDIETQKTIPPGTYSGSLRELAGVALDGCDHELGTVEYVGSRTITIEDSMGPYSFLSKLKQEFEVEMDVRMKTSGPRIKKRYIDFYKRIGRDTNKEIRRGKDLLKIERLINNDRIITALQVEGPKRADGTRLSVMVSDEAAFQRWNVKGKHRIKIYRPATDNQDVTVEELERLGEIQLKKYIDTIFIYILTAKDIGRIFEHERLWLGDRCRAVDEEFSPPLYADARAIRVERSIADTAKKVVKIGEVVTYTEDEIFQKFLNLQLAYGTRVIKSPTPPAGDSKIIWIKIKEGSDLEEDFDFEVAHTWNGTKWMPITPTKPEDVGAEPVIPEGPTPPSNPKPGAKWVDTSVTPVTLKIWDGLGWTAVQGPVGPQGPAGSDGIQGPKGDQGVQGPPGEDGVSSYTHIAYANSADGSTGFSVSDSQGKEYIGIYVDTIPTDSNIPGDYNWTLIKGQDGSEGIPGPKGEDGRTPYFHTAYANSADGSVLFSTTDSTGRDYLGTLTDYVQADSTNPSLYTWQKVKGDPGPQGVTGPPGPQGQATYTWLKYADSPTAGMSDNPTGKAYIGLAYNKTTASESSNYGDYTWSKIVGEKGDTGVPGTPGEDGQPTYTWLKYATSATGANMSDDPTGKTYIGLAYNKLTQAESNNAADYLWSLIQGPKGDTGPPGPAGPQGPIGTGVASVVEYYLATSDASGVTAATSGWTTSMQAMTPTKKYLWNYERINFSDNTYQNTEPVIIGVYGETGTPGRSITGITEYYLATSAATGVTRSTSGWTTAPQVTTPTKKYLWNYEAVAWSSAPATTYVEPIIIGIHGEQGPQGPQGLEGLQGPKGDQGIQGPKGTDGLSSYTHIAYATNVTGTTGFSVSDSTNKTYIGIYVDSNPVDSTDPTKYAWTLIKGADGSQGLPGPKGDNGLTPYFHTAWADSADGVTNFSTTTAGTRKYLGTYTDYTAADSNSPSAYTWSLIQGPKGDTGATGPQGPQGAVGPQGIQGPVGPAGQTTYTWLKYADTAAGAGMSDSPSGKSYIGIATNKTTAAESTDPALYTWSLIKGDQGIPGTPGADGVTTYTWVKYADSDTGAGISDSPTGKRYIGMAFNKTAAAESNTPGDYTWTPLYDNVEVGGRNLLRDSGQVTTNGLYNIAQYNLSDTINNGETVTFTMKAELAATKSYFRLYNSGGSVSLATPVSIGGGLYQVTFNWVVGSSTNTKLWVYAFTNAQAGTSTITWAQLERGNIGSDWTPAPEDIRTDLRLESPLPSSITMNDQGITATTPTSSNFARLDYRGLYVQGGAIDIRTNGNLLNRGVVFDGNGLRGYNSAGLKTFEIDSNGNAYFRGIMEAGSIIGVEITGSTFRSPIPSYGSFGMTLKDGYGEITDGSNSTIWNRYAFSVYGGAPPSEPGAVLLVTLGSIAGGYGIRTTSGAAVVKSDGISDDVLLDPGSGYVAIDGYIRNESILTPTFVNGWTHFSTTSEPWQRGGYWKDKNEVVHLVGLIKSGTVTNGTVLFTLPVGYRPAKQEVFIVTTITGTARIDVYPNGQVIGARDLHATWTSLAGIKFKAA